MERTQERQEAREERRRRELAEISAALDRVPFGHVELTLHQGTVTEIRETIRRRLSDD